MPMGCGHATERCTKQIKNERLKTRLQRLEAASPTGREPQVSEMGVPWGALKSLLGALAAYSMGCAMVFLMKFDRMKASDWLQGRYLLARLTFMC